MEKSASRKSFYTTWNANEHILIPEPDLLNDSAEIQANSAEMSQYK